MLANPGEVAVDDIRDYVKRSIEKENASRKQELKRSRRIAVVMSALLLLALGGGGFALLEGKAANDSLKISEVRTQIALDQAVDSLHDLEAYYHTGSVPAAVLRALVEHSDKTVRKIPGDSNDVTKARIEILELLSVIEVSTGDAKAMQDALERNALADRLKEKDPSNPEFRNIWAMARAHLSTIQFKQCDCASAVQAADMSAEAIANLLEDKSAIATLLGEVHNDENEITLMHKNLESDYENEGDALKALGDIEGANKTYHQWLSDDETNL